MQISLQQVAADAFGNALGNSIAGYDWGGTARQSVSYSADEQAQDFAPENNHGNWQNSAYPTNVIGRDQVLAAFGDASGNRYGSGVDKLDGMQFADASELAMGRRQVTSTDAGGGAYMTPSDLMRFEKASYRLGDFGSIDPNDQFRNSERQYIKDNQTPAVPKFRSNVSPSSVSNYSLEKLNKIALDAGVDIGVLSVTSSIRTSADQARIMYEQLDAGNISQYSPAGQQLISIYNQGVQNGDTGADIKAAMTNKAQQLLDQGVKVSNHLGNPADLNVFDIAPSSIPPGKAQAIQGALVKAKANGDISNFLSPYTSIYDPAFHIEIKQPLSPAQINLRRQQEMFRRFEILQQNEGS